MKNYAALLAIAKASQKQEYLNHLPTAWEQFRNSSFRYWPPKLTNCYRSRFE